MNKDAFSAYHPLVSFSYFALILVLAMVLMHPVCLAISLGGAFAYSLHLYGARAVRRNLAYMLPLLLLTMLVNPAFNHQGVTVLAYLPGGNPLTAESLWYGLAAGTMVAAVVCWFFCFNAVMEADKFVYLFGRVIPALALLLSMILCFVPKFKARIREVALVQRTLRGEEAPGVLARARLGLTVLSIMVTWSLENAVETADSMKSRGYGLPGRSAFSLYRWSRRDGLLLLLLAGGGAYVVGGAAVGGLYWRYFPQLQGAAGWFTLSLWVVYALLALLPLLIDVREERLWRRLRSTI